MKLSSFFIALVLTTLIVSPLDAGERPNIVVIVSDDQGYADASYNPHSPSGVTTPHLDALAAESVICTNGYASGHVCSPTRAGLMTGRYQQRFGVYTAGEGGGGMPLEEVWIPTFLKPAGYVSGALGKWHLGLTPEYNAVNRGFDEFYGFMGRGAHPYFDHDDPEHPILRGLEPIEESGYLTTRITEEAVDFIDRHAESPFFLYVAYNAVHSPAEAPAEDILPVTEDPTRNTLLGMLKHLDLGVGEIVGKLKEEGIFENTLLIYLSDNGGSKSMSANNAPLRGFKQQDLEGGIRVPFIVSWPAELKGGSTCEVPVWSTDILPTILAAADLPLPTERPLDGKNMLPALKGEVDSLHDHLFWSSGGKKGTWAVRSGSWKLTGEKGETWLYDLEADIGETTDLKAEQPELVAELRAAFDGWLAEMAEPISGQPKRWTAAPQPMEKKDRNQKSATKPSTARPNVLFIVCDDLNTHVSTSGYPHIETPAFDALAARGMTFNRAFCQYPVCGPSRASLLNGLYPESTGVLNNTADIRETRPDTVSMPQFFKESGYWTASVGKVFHSPRHEHGEVAWDEFLRFDNDELPVVTAARVAFEAENGSVEEPKNRKLWKAAEKAAKDPINAQTPPGYGPSGLTDDQHKDGKNVEQVSKWLTEKSHGDEPFFIALGIQKPHVPFLAPQKYFDQYPQSEIVYSPDKPNLWDGLPSMALTKRYEQFGFALGQEDDALRREYMQAYHACVSFIDAQLAKVFATLEAEGLWDDTIVVLTSDHGYHLGDHFLWGKVSLFDIGAKVPMVIHAPGQTTPGAQSEAMVELIDLYPTLAQLTRLSAPDHLQGRSMVPLLGHPERMGRKKYAYSVVGRGEKLGYSLRNQRWRYAQWGNGEELYNLNQDPAEKNNLAMKENQTERLAEFRTLLADKQKEAASQRHPAEPTAAAPKSEPKRHVPKVAQGEKPNVLFLAVDDMNDWIGALETTPSALTPNIDRLAARGVNFTNAHTAGVFCAPSRAAIFSGQFASTTGCYTTANYFYDHPEIRPLQSSFAAAGYATFGAGKLFHHPAGAIDQRDWTEFYLRNQAQYETGWPLDSWSEEVPFPDPFPNSIYNQGKQVTGGLFLEWGAVPNDQEEQLADTMRANYAVEKLKETHDQPFFLAMGLYAPHFPNYCPQKYFDLYDPDQIELPPYKDDDLEDLPAKMRKQKENRRKAHHDKLVALDAVDDAIHGYLACISYADAMIGRVLDALEASPYADNTIIVLWSDHGYHHGEKGDWGKHTLWERTSNVPFIWAGPGVAEGEKTDATVSLIDMYPTFVEMCDLPKTPHTLEGTSIAATLASPATAEDRNIFLPYMTPGAYAIINRDWRYIHYDDGSEEFYDVQADPNEWDNLATDPAHRLKMDVFQAHAPEHFAEPSVKLNSRKDLILEGESFRWEIGAAEK